MFDKEAVSAQAAGLPVSPTRKQRRRSGVPAPPGAGEAPRAPPARSAAGPREPPGASLLFAEVHVAPPALPATEDKDLAHLTAAGCFIVFKNSLGV